MGNVIKISQSSLNEAPCADPKIVSAVEGGRIGAGLGLRAHFAIHDFWSLIPARTKSVAHPSVVPALCKLRKGRGTLGPVAASN
jgi:hypothetical protein